MPGGRPCAPLEVDWGFEVESCVVPVEVDQVCLWR